MTGIFIGSLIFGIALLVVALLGLCSTSCDSKAGMALYILIVTALFIGELIITFYIMNKYNIIKNASTQEWSEKRLEPQAATVFSQLVEQVNEDAESKQTWLETQNALECCGYEDPNVDASRFKEAASLCTGDRCLADQSLIGFAGKKANEVYCKDKLLALAKKYDLWVMVTSGALALCQLFSIMAASRLACCVSTDDGGHAGQRWRSWEHGGNAKTRGGGRNYEMRDRNEGGHQLSYA